ncbi:MAG: hypothetical protein QE271_03955 [Bacteriovoracaceae bacterium]|nr:hypothetical protein [Bacteriovoracaceae bacterium]
MKFWKPSLDFLLPLGIFLTSMLLFAVDSFAQNDGPNWRNRLEIGGGVVKTDLVEMLVKIEANSTITPDGDGGSYYVLVRFKGDAAINFQTSPAYVDISANFLGFGYDTGPNSVLRGYGDITFLNFNYARNLSLNESYHYNLSLIGLRAGVLANLSEDQVQFFAEASFDFVGLAFDAKRASDGVALSPSSFGTRSSYVAAFETGVNLFKRKVRLAIGGQVFSTSALGDTYYDGTFTCTTYTYFDDITGQYYDAQDCQENTSTYYAERWTTKKFYVDLTVRLSKALRVFGRAGVQVFSLEDDTGYFPNSTNHAWMYQVGVSYNLNNIRGSGQH